MKKLLLILLPLLIVMSCSLDEEKKDKYPTNSDPSAYLGRWESDYTFTIYQDSEDEYYFIATFSETEFTLEYHNYTTWELEKTTKGPLEVVNNNTIIITETSFTFPTSNEYYDYDNDSIYPRTFKWFYNNDGDLELTEVFEDGSDFYLETWVEL